MTPSATHAPWQLAPVSSTSRVATAALAAIAVDSGFLWQVTPHFLVSFALTAIPILLGIRVIRGFPRSAEHAAAAFVAFQLASVGLFAFSQPRNPQVTAALIVAIVLATTGLAAIALGWARTRRRPVIELTAPAPVLARARTPRQYR